MLIRPVTAVATQELFNYKNTFLWRSIEANTPIGNLVELRREGRGPKNVSARGIHIPIAVSVASSRASLLLLPPYPRRRLAQPKRRWLLKPSRDTEGLSQQTFTPVEGPTASMNTVG